MAFSKITKIIMYVIAGISLVLMLLFYISPNTVDIDELEMRVEEALSPVDLDMPVTVHVADTAETDTTAVEETAIAEEGEDEGVVSTSVVLDTSGINLRDYLSGWEYIVYFRTDIALVWAYILFFLTAIASLVFPLISVFTNPKGLISLGAVLGGAALLIVISYLFASETPIDIVGFAGDSNKDPGTLKMVGTALFVTYMLFALALLAILYSIISSIFK